MPDFPIVDTHLHVWDPRKLRYPWLAEVPLLNKPYLLDDYDRACGPIQVEKMVFVQAECDFSLCRQEVDWVTSLSRGEGRLEGIVAWAPLERGRAARAELETLAENPLVKGIRRIIQFEPDLEFCLRPEFVEGVGMLSEFGMSFDLCIAHIHMKNTVQLIRLCPHVRFVLDHIGKPDIKNHLLDPWRKNLKLMASLPNVWCKMSGLVTEADHQSWSKEDLQPYIDHVLECFGFPRVMYGGDWPVALQATDYPRWVETLDGAVWGCSEGELRGLFRDNAMAFYRLEPAGGRSGGREVPAC